MTEEQKQKLAELEKLANLIKDSLDSTITEDLVNSIAFLHHKAKSSASEVISFCDVLNEQLNSTSN